MKILLLLIFLKIVTTRCQDVPEPVAQQIVNFKERNKKPVGTLTTSAGAPIEYNDAIRTLNTPLLSNDYFMDSMTHVVTERIPERAVHAKAAGAFGYFEITHNISDICKATFLSAIGKKTPVVARFSPGISEKGGIDTGREVRGFAVKFYTEEGNFDIIMFNTPIYVYKDPILFGTFAHAGLRNPVTHLHDNNTLWDFLTLRPETLHTFMYVFSDVGIPDGYRHMPGFGIHSFQVVNENGDIHFIRFHFIPDAGIKNLRSEQARKIASLDPDYAIRDLYNAIGKGDFPSWKVSIQVLTLDDVKTAGFDVFDVTKVLPLDKYPLRPLGTLYLNRNPINYFAEVEQLAFCPGNLVPGIVGAPDKIFESRRLAYRAAQVYRLGGNFNKIPVNCPRYTEVYTYNRDGVSPVNDNERDLPNYFPNSFNGAVPYVDKNRVELLEVYQDVANNFDQARAFYTNELTRDERRRLVENILFSLSDVIKEIQDKAVKIFKTIHPDLGNRVERGLQGNTNRNSTYQ